MKIWGAGRDVLSHLRRVLYGCMYTYMYVLKKSEGKKENENLKRKKVAECR